MTDGLKDVHREAIIAAIAANDRVERAVLFNSPARATNTASSDVHIALFGDRLTLTDQTRLAAALDEIPTVQSVDLLLYDSIQDQTLREHILRQGTEWYARPRRCSILPSGTTHPRGLPPADSIYWPLVPARDLFKLTYGRALAAPDRRTGNVPVYGTNGRCGTHDAALFEGPGVILGRKGQGPLGVEWSRGPYWVIDTAYTLTPLRQDTHLKFAYYLLKFIGLNHLKDGTSNPTLSRETFGAQALPWPPVPSQCAIAHVLGTLDDKIELNRRMNATLEAMVRTLCKSWFVDFDPVRAKMEGRNTGLPKDIADLFPDRLVDSEWREMPEGWGVGVLTDMSVLNPEVWTKHTRPSEIRYVDLSNTKWGRIDAVTIYDGNDAPSRARRVLRAGDTILGTVRPGNGAYSLVSEPGLTASTGFAVLRPRIAEYTEFVYVAATTAANIDALSHLADGGAYPAVRPEVVGRTPIVRPDHDLVRRFSQAARPIFARIHRAQSESRTLVRLRSALLPKLVSGELPVKRLCDLYLNELAAHTKF